jgi:putative tryptophan/tyrosine transport system substrate-binding protein
MRRSLYLVLFVLFLSQPCFADTHFHIEVLQIGNSNAYDTAYEGIVGGLARQGFVKGSNLSIARTVLEVNSNPSLWQRITALFFTRSIASSIIETKPDLVITLGDRATNAFSDKIMKSGIPVVFSGVCHSDNTGAGVIIRSQPSDMIGAATLALPDIDKLGIIRTSDPEAAAFSKEMEQQAELLGIQVITREIDPSESVGNAARELFAQGVDAFIIPPDSCFEANEWNAAGELIDEATSRRIPCISALPDAAIGTLMTLAPDFETIGDLTAKQAGEILNQGKKPDDLSVIAYTDQNFVVDLSISKRLGIHFRPNSSTLLSLNN